MTHALTYDTLPAHSRLQREFSDGQLKLVASAEEPGALVRRAALLRAAVPAAWIFLTVLVLGVAVFGATFNAQRPTMPSSLMTVFVIAFAVFCAALFALVWRAQYHKRLDAAARALRQSTVIVASPGRLLIETSGPFGSCSYDLQSVRGLRRTLTSFGEVVDCLQVVLADGTRIHILPGRDEMELKWVAKALARFIREGDDVQSPN